MDYIGLTWVVVSSSAGGRAATESPTAERVSCSVNHHVIRPMPRNVMDLAAKSKPGRAIIFSICIIGMLSIQCPWDHISHRGFRQPVSGGRSLSGLAARLLPRFGNVPGISSGDAA